VLWLARAIAPGAAARRAALSARAVRDVFVRPNDFLMGYLNAPKLKLGPFLLGMDPGPRHAREKAELKRALEASVGDMPAIVAEESAIVLNRLAQRGQSGTIDLAADYAEPVFVRSLARCFGLPLDVPNNESFDVDDGEKTLALYIRTLGATIGSSHPAPFGLEQLAKDVAPGFRQYLEQAVSGQQPSDATIIGRLLAAKQQPNAEFPQNVADIVRSVGGMLSAGAGFPKAFANAVHELLARAQMDGLRAAVAAGDEALVKAYVREALRFRPVFPMLVRYCPRATRLPVGGGCPHSVDIAAGSGLPFFPLGAMFDSAEVERPEEFIVGRPDHVYFLFGGAPRSCIAEPLIMEFFLPMFAALFRAVPRLSDAPPGRFRYDGAGLESYVLAVERVTAIAVLRPVVAKVASLAPPAPDERPTTDPGLSSHPSPSGDALGCPAHGEVFDAQDGAVPIAAKAEEPGS
jgi:cytochrome P450